MMINPNHWMRFVRCRGQETSEAKQWRRRRSGWTRKASNQWHEPSHSSAHRRFGQRPQRKPEPEPLQDARLPGAVRQLAEEDRLGPRRLRRPRRPQHQRWRQQPRPERVVGGEQPEGLGNRWAFPGSQLVGGLNRKLAGWSGSRLPEPEEVRHRFFCVQWLLFRLWVNATGNCIPCWLWAEIFLHRGRLIVENTNNGFRACVLYYFYWRTQRRG